MNISSNSQFPWIKSFTLTTLFCFVIAITTQTIWGGDLVVNLAISFGFGYSAVGSSFILVEVFKRGKSKVFDVGISMVIAMTFGTLNAHYWLNGYFGANISDLKSVVLLGVIFCSVCYYYFYTREQQLRADNELKWPSVVRPIKKRLWCSVSLSNCKAKLNRISCSTHLRPSMC